MILTKRLRYLVVLALFASLASALNLMQAAPGEQPAGEIGPGGAPPAGSGPVDVAGFVGGIDGDTMETWIEGSRMEIGSKVVSHRMVS